MNIENPTTGRLLQDQFANQTISGRNPNPWVVETSPGTDEEDIWREYLLVNGRQMLS